MGKKYLYQGKVYKIFRKNVDLGKVTFEKDYIEGKDRVVIIPVTNEGKLLLLNFPLLAVSGDKMLFSLRFPRGVVDKGEKIGEAAKRELLEETGFESEEIVKLSCLAHPNPAAIKEKWNFFVARDLKKIENYEKDKFEDWGIVELSEKEFEQRVKNGKITDASAIVAFYFYKLLK